MNTFARHALLATGLAALLAGCATAPAPSGPTAVYHAYERALNRGDLDGVMALFTEDVAFNNPGRCRPNPCRGKQVVRDFIQETVMAVRGQLRTIDVRAGAADIDVRVEFTSEKVRAAGFQRILGNERWKFRGDRIEVFEFAIERNDEQSMGYIRSLMHAAAQEAARRAQEQKR